MESLLKTSIVVFVCFVLGMLIGSAVGPGRQVQAQEMKTLDVDDAPKVLGIRHVASTSVKVVFDVLIDPKYRNQSIPVQITHGRESTNHGYGFTRWTSQADEQGVIRVEVYWGGTDRWVTAWIGDCCIPYTNACTVLLEFDRPDGPSKRRAVRSGSE